MNLEEARNNIGAEVELDESTKPYTDADGIYESKGYVEQELSRGKFKLSGFNRNDVIISKELGSETMDFVINPRHLKLKPQDYKIHVPTEAESREAQELFFELGCTWISGDSESILTNMPYIYYYSENKKISIGQNKENFDSHENKQITLQDLREIVAKKKGVKTKHGEYNPMVEGLKTTIAVQDFDSNSNIKAGGALYQDFEARKEMTIKQAYLAFLDDNEVEFLNRLTNKWLELKQYTASFVLEHAEKFRLAPQRITLNGNFTKEELLQKIEEME